MLASLRTVVRAGATQNVVAVANVRFGSLADICSAIGCPLYPEQRPQKRLPGKGHVCFTPESRHLQCTTPCPLWANSGHSALIRTLGQHGPATWSAASG